MLKQKPNPFGYSGPLYLLMFICFILTQTPTFTQSSQLAILNKKTNPLSQNNNSSLNLSTQQSDYTNQHVTTNNRHIRATLDSSKDDFNILVSATCDFESMSINVQTARPFFGVIHSKNKRQTPCLVEGNGAQDYSLNIHYTLIESDPNYCGVVRARRDSPSDKNLLSVVVAVRFHKNIEISEDKSFLFNCTDRCSRPDCRQSKSGNLKEQEDLTTQQPPEANECTIYSLPWAVAALWCMAIIIIAMIIFQCIVCSSLTCRWVKSEVVEKEPSVFEETDYGDSDDDIKNKTNIKYRAENRNKQYPIKIDYDNKGAYKTSHHDKQQKHSKR